MRGAKSVERPSPLTGLAHSGIALGGALVFLARELLEGPHSIPRLLFFTAITGIGIVFAGLWGLFISRTTKFVADEEEFLLERTFIWASSKRVDYTKVQAVELAQPFAARLLRLAKVRIDVGGSGGVDLAFLSLKRAEAMRELILSRAHDASASDVMPAHARHAHETPAPTGQVPAHAYEMPPAQDDDVVVRLRPSVLMLGTLVSTSALAGIVTGGAAWLLAWWLKSPIAVMGLTLAIAGWFWSQLGGNWGFIMTRQKETLRIVRGLASTTAQGLHPERIQGVVISQDLLQRLTGLYRVHVTVLGFETEIEESASANNSLVLPYGTREDVARVVGAIWPTARLDVVSRNHPPQRARWLMPLAYPHTSWGFDDGVLVSRHGWLNRTVTAVPHQRMQSFGITQGPLQRRLGLATVAVHTTDGPVDLKVRDMDAGDARALFMAQLERARAARAAAGQR